MYTINSSVTKAAVVSIKPNTTQCDSHNHIPGLTKPHHDMCSPLCPKSVSLVVCAWCQTHLESPHIHWLKGQRKNKCSVDSISVWHRTHKVSIGQWRLMRFFLISMASLATNQMKASNLDGAGVFHNTSEPCILCAPVVEEFVNWSHREFSWGVPLPGPFILPLR